MLTRLFGKKPSEYKARIAPANVNLTVGAKETLLQAALTQGVAFPNSCRAGGCGSCKCRLVKGKVKELTDKSYILSAEELRDNYILACQSIPQSDLEIDVQLTAPEALAPVQKTGGRIERMTPLTHDIVQLVVTLDHAMTFTPGQYAQLSAATGNAAGLPRSYSFANVPAGNGASLTLEFFIRRVAGGRFTEWLFRDAKVGDGLDLEGPYGDFILHESDAPMLCIAGGSGLAPVLSILQGALQTLKRPRDVTLIFGARTQDDLYMLDAIEALRQEWPVRFEFVPVLANEPGDTDWAGRRGLLPDHLATVLGDAISRHHAYLCGPPGMIDSCVERLNAAGMLNSAIHFDKFLDQSHLAPVPRAA